MPMTPQTDSSSARRLLPILAAAAFVVAVLAVAFVLFVADPGAQASVGLVEPLSAEAYLARIEPLLADADPAQGEALINEYECYACHIAGAPNIAPGFVGLGQLAAERRPPMTAAAYLYEAILYPHVHIVAGYADAMPRNYVQRMRDREIGDLVAYLLTQ